MLRSISVIFNWNNYRTAAKILFIQQWASAWVTEEQNSRSYSNAMRTKFQKKIKHLTKIFMTCICKASELSVSITMRNKKMSMRGRKTCAIVALNVCRSQTFSNHVQTTQSFVLSISYPLCMQQLKVASWHPKTWRKVRLRDWKKLSKVVKVISLVRNGLRW